MQPTMVAIALENNTLNITMVGRSPKAIQVDQITMGLIVGAAKRKEIATDGGTLANSNLLATGTFPHSQTGNKKPIQLPTIEPSKGFLGNLEINCFSLIKNNSPLESNVPSKRKGIASTNKLKNSVKASCS